ncbi:efflux RND transporter periplasmic adaptor subunit [Tenacibaculum sp. M341]|uniref:efflux RND transporter periplasmic adaptor subunit n=1 Tax=Tenacibaculum sp. M341 TaxID=2530339 RepID=UPI001046BFB9|nr:HlyD family efflux transporter periplasmic adaptor subunit [Tenacibaculum sp. M341]TCI93558.1 HlyD family efflux transporter periplasmic adaptor subunit [Tenacibaculum sp. M341]
MRKIILSILGILIIAGAVALGNYITGKKKKRKPNFSKIIKTVFIEDVVNKEVPITLNASGNLIAKNKIEIFSEVQGVLKKQNKPFKAGTRYRKGEVLLNINSAEFYANLQSQRNNLFNLVTSIMPDIRLDYPSEFNKWENYLQQFNVNKSTPELPEMKTDKEKYFISGRGITSSYYTIKNLEVRLGKYNIRAPFTGILTESLVSPGALVRNGQKLGEFIDESVYELEVTVNSNYADLLVVGNSVTLTNLEKTKTYTGKVVRVNGKVDLQSQTIKVYIEVAHKDLKEGMYLEANLKAKVEKDAIEISRKLLVDNSKVYTVKNDSILSLVDINPVHFNSETVIIKGLNNNTKILTQVLPGAFEGMIVKTSKK